MGECSHSWHAVNSRSSQCRKCGVIEKSPCREMECATLAARIDELEKVRDRQAGMICRLQDQIDDLQRLQGYNP